MEQSKNYQKYTDSSIMQELSEKQKIQQVIRSAQEKAEEIQY